MDGSIKLGVAGAGSTQAKDEAGGAHLTDPFTPRKVGAFSARGQGASERCGHGVNMVRFGIRGWNGGGWLCLGQSLGTGSLKTELVRACLIGKSRIDWTCIQGFPV